MLGIKENQRKRDKIQMIGSDQILIICNKKKSDKIKYKMNLIKYFLD